MYLGTYNIIFTDYHVWQADTWASSPGSMVDGVMKTSQEVIEYGWSRDRAPVDTFIMGLAACIRDRIDYDEQVIFHGITLIFFAHG